MSKTKSNINVTKITFNFLFLCIISFTFLPKYFIKSARFDKPENLNEAYYPNLSYINSMAALEAEISKRINNNFSDTTALVNTIDNVLRERFYHGYSEYNLSNNWIAYLCGKLVWHGFLYPVVEDDILKYPMAACSQQGLVFQKFLKKYKITYATIAFLNTAQSPGGHYAVSAFYNKSWHFFDSDKEPIKIKSNSDIGDLIHNSILQKIYPDENSSWLKQKIDLGLIKRVGINKITAPKMFVFQVVSDFLSKWLWFLWLLPLLIIKIRS